jgi:enoyl-CoA hydratase/carnithine racemase
MSPFKTQPPTPADATLSYPSPHILLVTLNRPRDLNCISAQGHADLHALWEWLDTEPSLRVGVLTGKGRAFCAGADLKGPYYTAIDTQTPHFTVYTNAHSRMEQPHV